MGNWYPGIYKMGWPAGISASWPPPGTFSRCDRALGRHSATTAARSLARADSCTVSRRLCPRSLGNMNLGAYSYGKWELKPECEALQSSSILRNFKANAVWVGSPLRSTLSTLRWVQPQKVPTLRKLCKTWSKETFTFKVMVGHHRASLSKGHLRCHFVWPFFWLRPWL